VKRLGLALAGQQRTEEAFRALNAAIELDPRLPEAQYALARLYFDKPEVDRRLEELLGAEARIVADLPPRAALH